MVEKNILRKKFSKEYERFYPVLSLRQFGYKRSKCRVCGKFFWATIDDGICGEPSCSGGYRFIGDSPAKANLDYLGVWKEFSRKFYGFGYKEIKRYPCVARWNPTTDFTIASISAFQPYVVSGEVAPPENPLVIPQFCLRFNDIDNVGFTGHNVGFVMMGQHAFVQPKDFDKNKYLSEIILWLKEGLKIPLDEIKFHEDVWSGGGNFGSCMEFFSRGLELGNQVYMEFEETPNGARELNIKVLDMGQGQERAAWFCSGASTSYESMFASVLKKLYKETRITPDYELLKRFLPYSSYLNVDYASDRDKTLKEISIKIGIEENKLKSQIMPLSAIYSIAEHTRALLFAIGDGMLPSNVGGGYNLRVIFRRAYGFVQDYKWDIDLLEIIKEHANYLKTQYGELKDNVPGVLEILDAEKKRFYESNQKNQALLEKVVLKNIDTPKLLELYDSFGINPEIVRSSAQKIGKDIEIPEDFYIQVAKRHEVRQAKTQTKKRKVLDLLGLPGTLALYFDDYKKESMQANVLKVIDKNVILDKTVFYPTSGGQLHDIGELDNIKVLDVYKQGNIIVHVLEQAPKFRAGEQVLGRIDLGRRKKLAVHHSATHVLNAAAKKVLGRHVWQAGAAKYTDRARLDITHYDLLTQKQIQEIEMEANKIVSKGHKINKFFLRRDLAEKKYGMGLYQGGVAPGQELRIVEVDGIDVEACGGTHLDNTKEIGKIKITKTSKISDGIIRIEFVAGEAAAAQEQKDDLVIEELTKLLSCAKEEIPGRIKELFFLWKQKRKRPKEFVFSGLTSKEKFSGDVLLEGSKILKTQKDHLISTLNRFLEDIKK